MEKYNDNKNNNKSLEELIGITVPAGLDTKGVFPSFEEVQMWKEYNSRQLVINEGIYDLILIYAKMIIEWNKEDKDIPINERKPIKILLFSYGGDLDICNAFYNVMLLSKTPIHVFNMGICASAGAIIFLAGHKRYALPGAKFLIHEGEIGMQGQATKVIENIENAKKMEKELEEFIISRTKIDKKLYNKNKKKEWWISGEEAVNLGIIESIIDDIDMLY